MPLTFAGRLLFLLTLLLTAAVGWGFYLLVPPGRYPLIFLGFPSLVLGGIFFGLTTWVLGRFGTPVWIDDSNRIHDE